MLKIPAKTTQTPDPKQLAQFSEPAEGRVAPVAKKNFPGLVLKTYETPTHDGPKALVFGRQGTGKTYLVDGLLRLGHRVLMLSTDFGGSGVRSFENSLRRSNPELLRPDRFLEITAHNLDGVRAFFDRPADLFPIWDFDPTAIVWDGFSGFQTNVITPYASKQIGEAASDQNVLKEGLEKGERSDQQSWGIVRNVTLEMVDKVFKLRSPDLSKPSPWTFLTALEGVKRVEVPGSKPVEFVTKPSGEPDLQGSAKARITAAVDLVIHTRRKTVKGGPSEYILSLTAGSESKARGFAAPSETPADWVKLFEEIKAQNLGQETEWTRAYPIK